MSDGLAGGEAGLAALAQGRFAQARAEFEQAISRKETAELHEVLAGLCMVLEDLEQARRHGEAAYRQYREAGNARRAAAVAIQLVGVYEWEADDAAMSGWLARARRLLDGAGDCVERGHLEVARIACEVHDIAALERSASVALEVARRFGDSDLEVRALADSGLALVSRGSVTEGLARLDEAMAAVVGGEVRSHFMAGTSCCAMLHACDRLGDLDRARQWTDAVFTSSRERFGDPPPVVLQSHCRLMYGTLLGELGRWDDAEVEFLRARDGTRCVHYRADASGRLADLRLRQGRTAEAAELLAGFEDRHEVAHALGRLQLARGEPGLAAATLRRALRELMSDSLAQAPLLGLLVEVELAHGDLEAARTAAAKLGTIAAATDLGALHALSDLSAGRIARAAGDAAIPHFHAALAALPTGRRPLLRADMHLELAQALSEPDPAAAVAEANAALAMFERLGAREGANRATALLRQLGVSARVRGVASAGPPLSRREHEVLALVGEGLSNAEIGRRLFISAKTAEHHVGAILGKLGMRTRVEAAAFAAAAKKAAVPT